MTNGDAEKERITQEAIDLFWEWALGEYGEEGVETLRRYANIYESDYWDYFLRKIYYPEYGIHPREPAKTYGRPTPEKFGLTDTDWKALQAIQGNPENVQKELEGWIESGYITKLQARAIWDEMAFRVSEAAELLPVREAARRAAREKPGISAEEMRRLPRGMRYLSPRAEERARAKRAWRGASYEPRYGPALERLRMGFEEEVPQTERWQDWFRSKYPRLVEQFEAQLPAFTMGAYPKLTPEEAQKQIRQSWAEYLRKRKPQLKEEWYKLSPYQRGEFPSRYAPRIQTIGF